MRNCVTISFRKYRVLGHARLARHSFFNCSSDHCWTLGGTRIILFFWLFSGCDHWCHDWSRNLVLCFLCRTRSLLNRIRSSAAELVTTYCRLVGSGFCGHWRAPVSYGAVRCVDDHYHDRCIYLRVGSISNDNFCVGKLFDICRVTKGKYLIITKTPAGNFIKELFKVIGNWCLRRFRIAHCDQ